MRVYLAQPYSHSDRNVRVARFEQGIAAAAALMAKGHVVIAPVVHSHPIYDAHPETGADYAAWQALDEMLMLAVDAIFVLCIPGWQSSHGLQEEIIFAEKHGIPVHYIDIEGRVYFDGAPVS